jgi:predicted outer membrane repeat protein
MRLAPASSIKHLNGFTESTKKATLRSVTFACLAVLIPISARSDTIRVPADQPTIQAAIAIALVGDTVLMAPGVYTGPGNVDLDFLGKDLVLTSEAGPKVTAIDGEAPYGYGPRGIVFARGETRAAVVEGLTFRRCSAPPPYQGGAILCTSASPTIRNCVFEQNSADSQGGGIFLEESTAEVRDCTFLSNWGWSAGGGIACHAATPTISGCTFLQNGSNHGGGSLFAWQSSVTLDRCRFTEGGDSKSLGSALWAHYSVMVATSCLFDRNEGEICIYADYSELSIMSSTLVLNIASTRSQTSGIRAGGDASVTLQNTIVAFAVVGAAFQCSGSSSIDLACCDVFGNADGDWVDCAADQLGTNGNISEDPLLCDAASGDFTLDAASPCAPEHSGGCGLIGAFPVHCRLVAAEAATWGRIKARFR